MRGKIFLIIIIITGLVITPVYGELLPREFITEVAKGNVPGHELALVNGHNDAVGTTEELLWQGPYTDYIWPTTAKQLNVTSTNITDTLTGVGARIVQVIGLDADYKRINETINMNGQTPVTTTNSYLRINQLYVLYSGSTQKNQGNIYIGEGATIGGLPNIVYYMVNQLDGYSDVGIYTVPANFTFVLYKDLVTTFIGSSKEVQNNFNIRVLLPPNNRTTWNVFEFHSSDIALPYGPVPPFTTGEKTDIFFTCLVDVGTGICSRDLTGIIIHDSVINNSTLSWANGDPSFAVVESEAYGVSNGLNYILIAVIIILALAYRGK